MRSSKGVKRSKKYTRPLRNHNARKRSAHIRQKANLQNWLNSTIGGPTQKTVTLSAVHIKAGNKPINNEPKPKKVKEPKVKEETVEPIVSSPSHSKAYEEPRVDQQQKQSTKQKKEHQKDQVNDQSNKKKSQPKEHQGKEQKKNDDEKEEEKVHLQNVQKQESTPEKVQPDAPPSKQNQSKKKKNKETQRQRNESSTVIKAEVENFEPSESKSQGLNEELTVDVNSNGLLSTNEASLTKCSMDSGVDTCVEEAGHHPRSGSNSLSNSGSMEGSPPREEPGMLTKFAQNVAQFVNQVQEKFEVKEETMITETVQKLESKTYLIKNDYSDLQMAKPLVTQPREKKPRVYKLLPRDIDYCTYMMETYGEDFKSMSKDSKNIYMDDPNGIARKIRIFRESPHYEEYLASKAN